MMSLNNSSENKRSRGNVNDREPYLALYSFREEDRHYFFGREREIKELVDSVKNNVLTVVLGKSGIGKTSLLQAGLIPRLRRKYYLPIYIRIRFDDDKMSPIEQVKTTIESKIKELDETAGSFNGLTLWEYFRSVRVLEGHVTPLLFFDQFEELFKAGKQDPGKVNPLVTEIGDLVQNWLPAAVQEKFKDQTIPYSYKRPHYRVIFSLREEYQPQLKNLSRYMPSIINGRCHYRVEQMKGEDAIDAVLKPGKEIIKDPEVAIEIVRKVPESEDTDYNPYEEQTGSWEKKKIEPFLLSLFCYEINQKRLNMDVDHISMALLEEVKAEDIIEDFYEKNINEFEPNVKIAIEDLLLTAEGYRRLQVLNSLKTGYDVTDKDIEGLVNRRIIRKETRTGVDYIELIHDRLAPILKQSRDKRNEEKRRKKELEERKKKYRRMFITMISIAAVVLAILTVYAFYQRSIAEKESRNNKVYEVAARSANFLDKDSIVSFRLAEYAYNTEKTNPGGYNALLKAYHNDKFYSIVPGKKVGEFHPGSTEANFFAVFCPNKEKLRFVTVSSDRLFLWEGDKIEKIKDIESPKNDLGLRPKAACSPDGKYFAFLTGEDNKIGLWELNGDKIKLVQLEVGVRSMAFSPNSEELLTGNRDNTARLWSLDGTPRDTVFKGHEQEVLSAVFSPKDAKDKYVVTASWDKTARLWYPDGKEKKIGIRHELGVNSAVFSPNGKYIVTASNDSTARLWDLNGKELQVFDGHSGAVLSAEFSPDGNYIITGGDDNTARLWDLKGNQVFKFGGFNENIYTASFSPDDKYVLIAPAKGPAQLRLIDPEEIIRIVKDKGIRSLTEEEKKTHNL